MIDTIKNISTFIVLGALAKLGSILVESNYLFEFLDKNLVTILIALLAINTTTGSVVMTKLREISDKYNVDFSYTMSQIKSSIFEQVSLIVISLIILILIHSKVLAEMHVLSKDVFEALLASVFIASLYNLYDTANSIFIILKSESDN